MVQIAIPYAYGRTICVYAYGMYHMRIRVWYVPYAYGMKYAYGTQHAYVRHYIATYLEARAI